VSKLNRDPNPNLNRKKKSILILMSSISKSSQFPERGREEKKDLELAATVWPKRTKDTA
jgi:hypothetical protein